MNLTTTKRSKVLLFQWRDSAYDSLRYLQDLLGEEFELLGFKLERVIVGDAGWEDHLQQLLRNEQVLFAMGFSGVGTDLYTEENVLIWEAAQTPFINWSCDHPCYFPSRHAISSPWLMHCFVFPDHARYALEHFDASGMTSHVHLAMPRSSAFDETHLPLNERNQRFIYTKSGKDINKIEKIWSGLPYFQQKILFGASEELFDKNTESALPIIQKVAQELGLFLGGKNALTMKLMREIDSYVRFKRANIVMETLMDMPIDVFGTGWEHLDWSNAKHANYYGSVPLSDSRTTLSKYLGSISIHPLIEDSVHDRNFFAIAANVVPVSDSNRYSRSMMPLLEPYAFNFESQSIKSAVERVIGNPQEALDLTEQTRLMIEAEGTLRYSAQKVLSLITMADSNFNH